MPLISPFRRKPRPWSDKPSFERSFRQAVKKATAEKVALKEALRKEFGRRFRFKRLIKEQRRILMAEIMQAGKDPKAITALLDKMTVREYIMFNIKLVREEPVGDKRFRDLLSQAKGLPSPKMHLPEILQRCSLLFGMKSADAIYERDIRLAKPKPPPREKVTRDQLRRFESGEW